MEDNFQLMDDYLKGNLSKEGVRLFNSRLKNEPEFEVEFREIKSIQEAAHASAKLSTMAKLQEIEMSISEKETTKTEFSMKKLVSVAASLILIATVSYFTLFNNGDVATGQEIYNEFYHPYENLVTGVQRGESIKESITLEAKAFEAYEANDFVKAAGLFDELLKAEKSAANFFYSGISNLEAGNLSKAKENFNTVSNDYEDLAAHSKWYMAMTLLKENTEESLEEAIYALAGLVVDETSYKQDAESALAKLGFELSKNTDPGTIEKENTSSNGDSPDGSQNFENGRKWQWGIVKSLTGNNRYTFVNDNPIPGLKVGDTVIFYVIKRSRGKRGMGRAILIDRA